MAPKSAGTARPRTHDELSDNEPSTSRPAPKRSRTKPKAAFFSFCDAVDSSITSCKDDLEISSAPFFRTLKSQSTMLEAVRPASKDTIRKCSALTMSYTTPDLSGYSPAVANWVQTLYEDMESRRKHALSDLTAIAPSHGAMHYPALQADSDTAIRTGYLMSPLRVPPTFTTMPFYVFSWLCYHIQQSTLEAHPDELFNACLLAAAEMVADMNTTDSHDDFSRRFIRILEHIIPATTGFRWVMTAPAQEGDKSTIDFKLIRESDGYTIILFEVKLQDGKGGDPFVQACLGYKRVIGPFYDLILACGAPMFMIFLKPGEIGIGAAVYDTSESPVFERLGGPVIFEPHQVTNIAYVLWSLKWAVDLLIEDVPELGKDGKVVRSGTIGRPFRESLYGTTGAVKNAPKVGLEDGSIKIKKVIIENALYEAVIDFSVPDKWGILEKLREMQLHHNDSATTYLLNVNFPTHHPRQRQYGVKVQALLAEEGLAPDHCLEIVGDLPADLLKKFQPHFPLPTKSLIVYNLSEQPTLPNIKLRTPGYISLDVLGEQSNAVDYKRSFEGPLDQVLRLLESNSMMHGDLSPKNVYIFVDIDDLERYRPVVEAGNAKIQLINFGMARALDNAEFRALKEGSRDRAKVQAWIAEWPQSVPAASTGVKDGLAVSLSSSSRRLLRK